MEAGWICRACGREVDAEFAFRFMRCPSLTGCGSDNIRPMNDFDGLRPHEMAEVLSDLNQRLSEVETILDAMRERDGRLS